MNSASSNSTACPGPLVATHPKIEARCFDSCRGTDVFDVVVPAGLVVTDDEIFAACNPRNFGGRIELYGQPDGSRAGKVRVFV